jgi:mono/diheme cytochrome c family protein
MLLAIGLACLGGCSDLGDEAGSPAGSLGTSFSDDVQPILQANCTVCHSSGHESGLDLSSRVGLLAGGNSGPALVAGDADASRIVARVSAVDAGERMPPGGQLSPVQIQTLRDWIDEGAQDN